MSGVRLQRLPADVVKEEVAAFDTYFVQSERFEDGLGSRMPPSPVHWWIQSFQPQLASSGGGARESRVALNR